jgi:hypothetical protein
MAARRLIMILLVLLFVSSLTAALVPIDRSGDETSTTTAPPAAEPPAAELVHARIDTRDKRPKTIRMQVGDQLALLVSGHAPDEVEIPRLDLLEPVDLGAPARFELLADAAGTYPIRLLEARRQIGRIVVSARPAAKRKDKRGPSESGRRA